MTIDEAKKFKSETETMLTAMVYQFEQATGLKVIGITLETQDGEESQIKFEVSL